jgi:hypothetical protein
MTSRLAREKQLERQYYCNQAVVNHCDCKSYQHRVIPWSHVMCRWRNAQFVSAVLRSQVV